jgi:arylsulfatase A-like enzyme
MMKQNTPAFRPNIVLLLTDDHGFGDLGCYTNGKVHTPNLDELYHTSVRLNQFYVSPLCSPTRAALLTGCYPARVGVWDTGRGMATLRPDTTTLADILRHGGYRTGVFGKWHTGSRHPQRPSDTGFDRSAIVSHQKNIYDFTFDIDDQTVDMQGPREEAIFDQAMRFIEENADTPFFAYIASLTPHDRPLPMCPPEYKDRYQHLDEGDGDKEIYGMMSWYDENVGRLRRKLTELHLDETTIIIYFPDNGPLRDTTDLVTPWERHMVTQYDIRARYNRNLRAGKVSAYEGGVHVPCFVHLPMQRTARDVAQLCAHIDLLPTIVDLCGCAMPEDLTVDGMSFAPLLYDEAPDWPERVIVSRNDRLRHPRKWYNTTIRNSQFKQYNGSELYRLDDDPGESRDLASEYPHIVQDLRQQYETWWDDITRSNENFTPSYSLFDENAGSYHVGELTESPFSVDIEKQDTFGLPEGDQAITTAWKFSEGFRVKVEHGGAYDFSVNGIRRELLTDRSQCELQIGDAVYTQQPGSADSVEFAGITVPQGVFFIAVRITNLSSMPVTRLIFWEQGFQSLSYVRSTTCGQAG